MNTPTRLEKYQKRNRGIALIIVISIVAMLTVLTVAMLTISDNERRSSVKYAAGENASNLVDTAVSLVMKQIWDGTDQKNSASAAQPYNYATQPGGVRRYKSDGTFESGYKLYSSATMYIGGGAQESVMANDTPAMDWDKKPGEWVDLNEPVIRTNVSKPGKSQFNATIFPILDPRAVIFAGTTNTPNAGDSQSVEGFNFITGVVDNVIQADGGTNGGADSRTARLPMPVKWLYMLKDGTLGTMGDPAGTVYTFVGPSAPTTINPIVGRIAFWTDDESCKLNINTASEPTPWAPPSVSYDLDMQWVVAPPTRNEYQRYPGHPATVALSTVLMPNQAYDLYGFPYQSGHTFGVSATPSVAQIKKRRERLYTLLPKLAGGGSSEGTIPFWTMGANGFGSGTNNDGTNNNVSIASSLKKHLYATVDELLFSEAVATTSTATTPAGQRFYQDDAYLTGNDTDKNLFPPVGTFPSNFSNGPIVGGGSSGPMQPSIYLERVRGFLTASSRSPEMTMFGTPRVAMWPIADPSITSVTPFGMQTPRGGTAQQYRTAFDNAIGFCASMGKPVAVNGPGPFAYFFTRADPTSATYDVNSITRNKQLLAYLYNLMGRSYPTMVANQNASFAPSSGGATAKYDNGDAQQILTEIFDYIRSTNLVDGLLGAPKSTLAPVVGSSPQLNPYDLSGLPTGAPNGQPSIYGQRNKLIGGGKTLTYTMDRASNTYGNNQLQSDGHDLRNGQNQFLADDGLPGSGQVVPIEILPSVFGSTPVTPTNKATANLPNGTPIPFVYRGFGRFPTITEVGMMFICTADGASDLGSWHAYSKGNLKTNNAAQGPASGGRSVAKLDRKHPVDTTSPANNAWPINLPGGPQNPDSNSNVLTNLATVVPDTDTNKGNMKISRWYSNYPPNPLTNCAKKFLSNPNAPAAAVDGPNPQYHPAWASGNWNLSLLNDTPLADGTAAPVGFPERRVQGMICLKPTVVAAGWTGIYADFTVVVSGYDQMQLNGQPLFSHAQKLPAPYNGKGAVWRSNHTLFNGWGCRVEGASASPINMADGRKTTIYTQTGSVADTGYDATAPPTAQNYAATNNFDLVTDFVTVSTKGASGNSMMDLVNPTNIQIDIYAGNEPNFATDLPVQTLLVPFGKDQPSSKLSIPIPQLVMASNSTYLTKNLITGRISYHACMEAPQWWCLNYNGILGQSRQLGGRFQHVSANEDLFWGWRGGAQVVNGYGDSQGSISDPYSNLENFGGNIGGVTSQFPQANGNGNRTGIYNPQAQRPYGQDVCITYVAASGDFRHIAAKKVVGPGDWSVHPGHVNQSVRAAGTPSNPKMIRLIPAAQTQADVAANKKLTPDASYPQPSYMAHSFSRYSTNSDPGFSNGEDNNKTVAKNRIAAGAFYNSSVMPELPAFDNPPNNGVFFKQTPLQYVQQTADFDTGLANLRDGAWINRADEGNTSTQYYTPNLDGTPSPPSYPWMTAYFEDAGRHGSPAGESYMTPNRMISSPGMFGSLPTRIWGGASTSIAPQPWRTLLFRPHVNYTTRQGSGIMARHPGEPVYAQAATGTGLAKAQDPGDHYLLDLFWMPVVEPYAISEPLSTAGKINMNYQMVPFNKYIRRATGMHAVLKGELMGAFPTQDAGYYKNDEYTVTGNSSKVDTVSFPVPSGTSQQIIPIYNRKHSPNDPGHPNKYWYRNIVPDDGPVGAVVGTLGQFDDRFEFRSQSGSQSQPQKGAYGLFRTASQICEIHLLPKKIKGGTPPDARTAAAATPANPTTESTQDGSDPNAATSALGANDYKPEDMATFWDARAITGDNVRERPYANIYAKITTKSNTFRVHYRVQTISKARSMDPTKFDSTVDSITSEQRGSTLIERRIDPTSVAVDYATNSNAEPLSKYYSFRVLESKRFLP